MFATSKANPETMCKMPKRAATFGFDDDDDSESLLMMILIVMKDGGDDDIYGRPNTFLA